MASVTDEQKDVIRNATEGAKLYVGEPTIGYAEPLRPITSTGSLTVGEAADFWTKHKNKAWVAVLLMVGAVSGNVDELYRFIPDVHDVAGLRKEVVTLKTDVEALKRGQTPTVFRPTTGVPAPELPPPAPVDDGFRVERPTKQVILQSNVTVA